MKLELLNGILMLKKRNYLPYLWVRQPNIGCAVESHKFCTWYPGSWDNLTIQISDTHIERWMVWSTFSVNLTIGQGYCLSLSMYVIPPPALVSHHSPTPPHQIFNYMALAQATALLHNNKYKTLHNKETAYIFFIPHFCKLCQLSGFTIIIIIEVQSLFSFANLFKQYLLFSWKLNLSILFLFYETG